MGLMKTKKKSKQNTLTFDVPKRLEFTDYHDITFLDAYLKHIHPRLSVKEITTDENNINYIGEVTIKEEK